MSSRVFLSVSHPEKVITLLEGIGYEVIPLTNDSLVDNLDSFETVDVVVFDSESPSWILREIERQHKLAVVFSESPILQDTFVVASVDNLPTFGDLMTFLKPLAGKLKPLDEDYINRLALIKSLYSTRKTYAE
jgi:hypothetical protein